jgi:RNA polymerase sigma-70 factor (ECF subfamily)
MWIDHLERAQGPLRRHAAALLRDRRDADDLVRACLSRALERMETLNPQTDARTWLLSIMHSLLARRSWQARLRRANNPSRQGSCTGQLSALRRLSHPQRAVLLLVTIEDLPYPDVAQMLGIPVGQVMSLLAEGRERLRLLAEDAAMRGVR